MEGEAIGQNQKGTKRKTFRGPFMRSQDGITLLELTCDHVRRVLPARDAHQPWCLQSSLQLHHLTLFGFL